MKANLNGILVAIFLLVIGLVHMIEAQTCAMVPIGLVSAYSGDGNALDARSRNNGTIQNNVTYAAGNVGQAFQLGGNGNASNSGDRVIVGNPANLRLQTFTFEAWVKRSSAAILTNSPVAGFVNGTIFAFGASGWGVVIDGPTNRLAFTQIGVNNIISNLAITDTNWHHIAVSISDSQAVFYLDGVAGTPINYSSTFVLTTSAAIGARGDTDARNAFFGFVDELAIYNRVLSASEIAAIFNSGTAGKCKPIATNVPDGQVLWLAGDGDALDSSGNGNNATLQNGASYSVGKVGQGFQLNGTSFLSVADTPSLNPTAQVSVEGWVYPTTDSFGADSMAIILNKETIPTVQYELARRLNSGGGPTGGGIPTGNFAVFIGGISGLPNDCGGWVNGNAQLPLNTWSHVAMTYDGTNLRAFVNGVNTRIVAATGAIPTTNGILRLGKRVQNTEVWIGRLDEMSVYNRNLTTAEIESIANAGLAGKYKVQSTVPTGLVAWFTGDGNANDISGNSNNGTLQGGANYAVGKVGQGFQFDASASGVVSVADAPSLNPTAQISVEGWVYPTLDTIFPNLMAMIINKETNATVQFEMARRVSTGNCSSGGGIPTGNFAVYISGISGLPDDCNGWVNGNGTLPLNTWSHVAMTYDGANLRAFVNGVNTRTIAATGAIPTTNGLLRLGKRLVGTDAWVGQMDELSVYNRALSPLEIREQFYAGGGGKFKGAINPVTTLRTQMGDLSTAFPAVTTAGAVHQTPIDLSQLPPLPVGASSVGLTYDISTSTVSTGSTSLCFKLPALTITEFSDLGVLHLESGVWVDRATAKNAANRTICAASPTLSPFAIARVLNPTAANAPVSGRVTTADGSGIRNVRVSLTDQSGNVRSALTNAFGYYRFEGIEAGQTVVISIAAKRYVFANSTRIVTVQEELADIDFTAEP